MLTSGSVNILSSFVNATYDVSKFIDVTWFINCVIGSIETGGFLHFITVAVLYEFTFRHGLDNDGSSGNKHLNIMKYSLT